MEHGGMRVHRSGHDRFWILGFLCFQVPEDAGVLPDTPILLIFFFEIYSDFFVFFGSLGCRGVSCRFKVCVGNFG